MSEGDEVPGTPGWRFWIDQGGTFTDVVAVDPGGRRHVRKLLSRSPQYTHAPIQGIREVLGLAPKDPIPPTIESVRLGTTVATNALLERRGEPLALLITEGFADLLEIGYQERPELFALEIRKTLPLYQQVVEVQERLDASGAVRVPLDEVRAREHLLELKGEGVDSLAICLLHAYRNPDHELRLGALARELGFQEVSLSHQVAREMKVVGRGDTTCVDAYLTPLLRRYLQEVAEALPPGTRLLLMQSSGGLTEATHFSGKNAVLSGPAGGLIAAGFLAREARVERVIGFDMGGTSTDVSRFDGSFDRVYETRVAGVRLKAPMLDIRTVAAGGGSLLRFQGGRFQVGPESAGADPGPACYRRGGPLAVTDANLLLGRIQPDLFPSCFGPGGDQPLDREASREAFEELAREVREATGEELSPEEVAAGFLRIADQAMAAPVQEISVARGYDVREYTLLAFGGAAAQHACSLARSLGMRRVLLHPLGGVLSAYGMGLARVEHETSRSFLRPLDAAGLLALQEPLGELEQVCREELLRQGAQAGEISLTPSLDLRYQGVDQPLTIPLPEASLGQSEVLQGLVEAFEAAHRQLFGFVSPGVPLEVENLRVRAVSGGAPDPERTRPEIGRRLDAEAAESRATVWFPDSEGKLEAHSVPVFSRRDLHPGDRLEGPALVTEEVSTIVVDPGWQARVTSRRHLVLEVDAPPPAALVTTRRDPVNLELFHNLFMSCAEQMGRVLERVSHSTNIKERLDFSCALFDPTGNLIANAPHIPVHLGAMAATVQAVLEEVGESMAPGDVFLSNDPYHGGSHLPDVTVVTPVFGEDESLRFVVASRGHHADIGGITPGSMPANSTSIEEEGIRLHAFRLVSRGRFDEAGIRSALSQGPWPARNLPERLSDLRAQVAANQAGQEVLAELEERYGYPVLAAYMGHVLDNGEETVRELLRDLPDGERVFVDHLDEGARIQLTLTVSGERAVLDFEGTSPQLPGNCNAPRAVVRAAVLYAVRCLTPRTLPLNSGCMRPLELRIPEGCLLCPRPPAAVVGGNVETSQRVVDVLLGSLGKLAASQGTMNNLTFGDEQVSYYETLCGGAGAGLGFDGASAVHTHMTNTRITDPEVLEVRYPVLLRRFAVRRGSGGSGTYRGGDGVVRELEFLRPQQVSLLGERRALAPFGLHGGGAGASGRNTWIRGSQELPLPAKVHLELAPGDRLRIETPGGGGYEPTPGEWAAMRPERFRRLCREGRFRGPTCGHLPGRVQANLVVLPASHAEDFQRFCEANYRACPLLERLPEGESRTRQVAAGADLRFDLPRYRLHLRDGMVELDDLSEVWVEDAVAFLLGCSFSFEGALEDAGLVPRHVELGRNVPMYRTDRLLAASGPFQGNLVVSMRPYPEERAREIAAITGRFPRTHGKPVYHGDPTGLGIRELSRPDWGDPVPLYPGEVPFFWACGVTSQEVCARALRRGELPWYASHAPGHMLVGDLYDEDLAEPLARKRGRS